MDHKETPKEADQAAPPQRTFVKFPEDKIQGDGFTQLDPNTGWLWIGINLSKFSFRDAWAFIKSQEYMVSSYLSQREQQAMMRAQLAQGKAGGGISGLVKKLAGRA